MIVIPCKQGDDTWWEARRGVPTASNFGRILTPAKRKYSEQARKYMYELIGDLTSLAPNYFTANGPVRNTAMQQGVDCEPEARRWYALERGVNVDEVGFCLTDDMRFGASPDGMIGDEGTLELKCPLLKTQAEYLDEGVLPLEYMNQVHGQLLVTGRKWVDFMSYAPGLQPLLIRVEPNDYTDDLRRALEVFWKEFAALKIKMGVADKKADPSEMPF